MQGQNSRLSRLSIIRGAALQGREKFYLNLGSEPEGDGFIGHLRLLRSFCPNTNFSTPSTTLSRSSGDVNLSMRGVVDRLKISPAGTISYRIDHFFGTTTRRVSFGAKRHLRAITKMRERRNLGFDTHIPCNKCKYANVVVE